jgi:hypothetical protein
MGCGKGYLTFGLWHLFARVWKQPARVIGVETRADLVATTNKLAQQIKDGIAWYCDACGHALHELEIDCQDIETQLKAALDAFNADMARRTCPHCGTLFPDPAQQPPWKQMVEA